MSDFVPDPVLVACTSMVADWPLCRVLLMNDSRYFWLTLVPRLPGMVEIMDLSEPDRIRLMEEAMRASRVIRAHPGVTKLNIGALGNMVAQLHLHVIGRHPGDPAWPGPVWNHSPALPYGAAARGARIALVNSQ